MGRAKIVCTMGPAVTSGAQIDALLAAGMDVARLNFSHGAVEEHRRVFDLLRERAAAAGRPLAIMQDLQGPKIRLADLPADGLPLATGQRVRLVAGAPRGPGPAAGGGAAATVAIGYPRLRAEVEPGQAVLIDDGAIELRVLAEQPEADALQAEVVNGGTLRSRKGVAFPGAALSTGGITDQDLRHLEHGLAWGVDYVALSFVRSHQELLDLRRRIGPDGPALIAKLERAAAIDDLERIVAVADGVMVARGDMGVELGLTRVPLLQKRIIEASNQAGKIEIVATQMLESMIANPRPTRAEVSDVANAILDGADAVMLSGETAVGRYPVEAVRTMRAVIEEVEASPRFMSLPEPGFRREQRTADNALAHAAVEVSHDLELPLVALFTFSGHTARLVSSYRPHARVVAYTDRASTYRQLALVWGVVPRLIPLPDEAAALPAVIERDLLAAGLAQPDQRAVLLGRLSMRPDQGHNFMQVHQMSSPAGVES